MKKFYKCAYQLKDKILDKSYLGKVYHQGTLRGFFNSKEDCENYTKKLPNCKKIITTFNNDDVLNLVKRIKKVLKSKGYNVGRHSVIRYKSDDSNRSKAGVDMISISDEKNIDGDYLYPKQINELNSYVQSLDSEVKEFSGELTVQDGNLITQNITILHSRSIAEDVTISDQDDSNLFTGILNVDNGKIIESVDIQGKSLVSSAELTAKAFSQGIMGQYGGKLVAIALLLFAFSTSITWCYYGDRSTAYIFGEKGVIWYRNFYVLCFVLAAVIDTTIVWNIAYVVVALVSIPNLIAMFVLRKEMKSLSDNFEVK